MKQRQVSPEILGITVDREEFEDAVRRLLSSPPAPKTAIQAQIASQGRNRSLTKRILDGKPGTLRDSG